MNPGAGAGATRLISSGTLLAVAVYALVGGLLHALLPAAGFELLPATV